MSILFIIFEPFIYLTIITFQTIKQRFPFGIYLVKFLGIFCVLYFGTLAVIGLAAPGGYHSLFIHKYLDYVSWIKNSLINTTAFTLSLFQIPTIKEPAFALKIAGGSRIIIAMDCVGYGVYSFWIAFVLANRGAFSKKLVWVIMGLLALWLINDIRITLFLLAINRGWPMPLGIDHHRWFAIFAYLLIFILITLYDRSLKRAEKKKIAYREKTTAYK